MINKHSSLHNIIDAQKWQKLQDALALSTKMAIITTDYKGVPLTDHSSCCNFCRQVREDPDFLPYCQKCDSRAGLEAVRTDKPYVYFCHFDIVDVAIPIIIDDKYIGAVMAGQVRFPSNDDINNLEHMTSISDSGKARDKLSLLQEDYDAIPVLSYEQVIAVSDMIFQLCKYIVEEAIEKQLVIDTYSNALQNSQANKRVDELTGYSVENIKKVKKEMSNKLIDAYVSGAFDNKSTVFSPLLQPAIEYISKHKNEKISLKTVSEICHISPSYFSRMFYKETGENFSNYLINLKITCAKKFLENTDMSIYQISETLGFSEPSYFIKSFKTQTGVTPNTYRKNIAS